ncbi:MAG: hypothetical protein E3J72_03905 [Planctomycetota bacterium]|nr:MAG: hypothetical protein E3J72_03905 [Planctomycetota bacterium]
MNIRVAILGAGSTGRIVQEILETEKRQFKAECLIDMYDRRETWGKKIGSIEIAGGPDILGKLFKKGIHYVALALGEYGHLDKRIRAFELAEMSGFNLLSIISETAAVSRAAYIGSAVTILPNAVVMNGARIEQGTLIASGASVDHDCFIGEFATIGPGVHLGGCVRVETGAYLGIGSCVVNGRPDEPIIIGKGATVAAGAVVTKSVPAGKTVYGNPAKQKRKRRAGASKNKGKGKKK